MSTVQKFNNKNGNIAQFRFLLRIEGELAGCNEALSLKNMMNKSGSRIESRGTSERTGRGVDILFPTLTSCVWPLRQEWNHEQRFEGRFIEYNFCRRVCD